MPAIANTPIFAKRANINVYSEPTSQSNRLQFTTDSKNSSRDWETGDSIGYATGAVQSTSEGIFVQVVTRQWVQQKLSKNTPKGLFAIPGINVVTAVVKSSISEWVRKDVTAYVREGDYYTNDQRSENERAVIERRAIEAYDTLGMTYQAQNIYQNDAGIWMLQFANGYRISIDDYEKLSLVEKRNITLSASSLQSGITVNNPAGSETKTGLPGWVIGLLIGLGVTLIGLTFYTLTNGKSEKR